MIECRTCAHLIRTETTVACTYWIGLDHPVATNDSRCPGYVSNQNAGPCEHREWDDLSECFVCGIIEDNCTARHVNTQCPMRKA